MSRKVNTKVFVAYYNALKPKEQKGLRAKLEKECLVGYHTFYSWITEVRSPKPTTAMMVANVVGMDADELFPGIGK